MVYVDDIIFGSNNSSLVQWFASAMKSVFEMSVLGELSYFLGLQVRQQSEGMFISQEKYLKEILKKFNMEDSKPVGMPMETKCKLNKDDQSPEVDQKSYRSMIGSLLYLTTSRPNIMQVVGMVGRYQSAPKQSRFSAAKQILRYLKSTMDYGLWYPKNQSLQLTAYSYVGWENCPDQVTMHFSWETLWLLG